jgi:hypothetical protein
MIDFGLVFCFNRSILNKTEGWLPHEVLCKKFPSPAFLFSDSKIRYLEIPYYLEK